MNDSTAAAQRPRKERKANADMRRRQLLDAAQRSIVNYGLARTTLATVATEAGLSQGVAVFYFKSKSGLLTETLRDLYQRYESLWSQSLEDAGPDPVAQLRALIATDFHPDACGPDVMPIWFAFWGELKFTPQYAELAAAYDSRRRAALCGIWERLLPDRPKAQAAQFAEWMDTLTDGYWQKLHLTPHEADPAAAEQATRQCLAELLPDLRARLL